jgi:hypothetical protein
VGGAGCAPRVDPVALRGVLAVVVEEPVVAGEAVAEAVGAGRVTPCESALDVGGAAVPAGREVVDEISVVEPPQPASNSPQPSPRTDVRVLTL